MKTFACKLFTKAALAMLAASVPNFCLASQGFLGAPVTISGYCLRPPAGYAILNASVSAPVTGATALAWIGTRRHDSSHPTLEMMLMKIPAGESARAPLPFLSENFLGGVKRLSTNWRATPAQSVMIHGLHFYRTCWTGDDKATGLQTNGIQFVARDGDQIIILASRDPSADGTDGIKLAQNAISTICKVR